ncbi:MAG: hypothetical protein JOS17DRAFT_140385 [Linnemannia elongata]|nr:MAG: hypothetical protein JOS17DRAFT_140385 [Linnemannia elongata]
MAIKKNVGFGFHLGFAHPFALHLLPIYSTFLFFWSLFPLTCCFGPFLSSRSQKKTTKQLGPCPQLNPPSDAQNNTNQTIDARPRSVPSYLSHFSFPCCLRWRRVLFLFPLPLTFRTPLFSSR